MLEEQTVTCPHCGEPIVMVVDCSAGDQTYTEDCFVCCQPILVSVNVAPDGSLAHVDTAAEND